MSFAGANRSSSFAALYKIFYMKSYINLIANTRIKSIIYWQKSNIAVIVIIDKYYTRVIITSFHDNWSNWKQII